MKEVGECTGQRIKETKADMHEQSEMEFILEDEVYVDRSCCGASVSILKLDASEEVCVTS